MHLPFNNKHIHIASAFVSGFSLGYLLCLYKRKSKPTGGNAITSLPIVNVTQKCTGDVCPIDMTAVFKQADQQTEQQIEQPLN